MMMITESSTPQTEVSTPTVVRRGRVWKGPRPATDRAPRGAYLAAAAAVSMIAGGAVSMAHLDNGPGAAAQPAAADVPLGSMYRVVDDIGARALWEQGFTGAGVNVAVIDTGVAPVDALGGPDKLVAAVDLSDERAHASTVFVDNFGHGTHLAGIIAGRSPDADPVVAAQHPEWFLGVAPDAGIVSIKVAGRDGSLSPAALISGIDWVIANADDLDIRVINLAVDGASNNPRTETELAAAVERAWNAGIVVVTAAGNDGAGSGGLAAPASDPYVIAVGGLEATDDGFVVADFTSRGDGVRNPDIAAPGAHIESLRAPGSYADVDHPEGYVDQQRFLASGSSQAAAVAAGVAALLLDENPALTPDQVKAAMVASAVPLAGAGESAVGAGVISAIDAASVAPTTSVQTWERTVSSGQLPDVPGAVVDLQPSSSAWASSAWA